MTNRPISDGPTSKAEMAMFRSGCETVAGIDEVGRGAWAGPVAVGVAVVTKSCLKGLPDGIRDSKQLTELRREALFDPLRNAVHAYAVGYSSPSECDELGMTKAQALAAKRAFDQLGFHPDGVIIDGSHNYTHRLDAQKMIGGDRKSLVVAAASVLAKVTRDRLMIDYASTYPAFGFERNKGYASLDHRREVAKQGLSTIHRTSWSMTPLIDDQVKQSAESRDIPIARL